MTTKLPPESVPEVQEFMRAQSQLEDLKRAYPGVFEELKEIQERYNTLLEAADKAVREKGVTCGPFDQYQTATSYDAEKFYDAVGREEFLKLGGTIETIPRYDINKQTFDAMAVQSRIPKEIVEAVKTVSLRYKKPTKMIIP